MAKDTTYLKKIDEIVKQAAIEETFSLDVLNQIQALKTGFEAQAAEIERLNETIETRDKAFTEERQVKDGLKAEVESWKERGRQSPIGRRRSRSVRPMQTNSLCRSMPLISVSSIIKR